MLPLRKLTTLKGCLKKVACTLFLIFPLVICLSKTILSFGDAKNYFKKYLTNIILNNRTLGYPKYLEALVNISNITSIIRNVKRKAISSEDDQTSKIADYAFLEADFSLVLLINLNTNKSINSLLSSITCTKASFQNTFNNPENLSIT